MIMAALRLWDGCLPVCKSSSTLQVEPALTYGPPASYAGCSGDLGKVLGSL